MAAKTEHYDIHEAAKAYEQLGSLREAGFYVHVAPTRLARDLRAAGYAVNGVGGVREPTGPDMRGRNKDLETVGMSPSETLAWRIVKRALLDWHDLHGRLERGGFRARQTWPTGCNTKGAKKRKLWVFFHGEWFAILCEMLPGRPTPAFLRKKHRISRNKKLVL